MHHLCLLVKLDYCGVRSRTQDWLRVFLSNHTQEVVIEQKRYTNYYGRCSGIPQGSVLGPITVFLICIVTTPKPRSDPLLTTLFSAKASIAQITPGSSRLDPAGPRWLGEMVPQWGTADAETD